MSGKQRTSNGSSQLLDQDSLLLSGSQTSSAPAFPRSIQQMLDSLDRQAALVDRHGTIRSTNRDWQRAVARRPQYGLSVGECYTEFLKRLAGRSRDGVAIIVRAVEEIFSGTRWRFSTVYKGSDTFEGHYFKVTASRFYVEREPFAFITVQDVTALFTAHSSPAAPLTEADSACLLRPR